MTELFSEPSTYNKREERRRNFLPKKKKKTTSSLHKKETYDISIEKSSQHFKEKKKKKGSTKPAGVHRKKNIVYPFQAFLHPGARDFVNVLTAFNIPLHSHTHTHLFVARLKGMIDAWHATDTPTTRPGLRWIFRTIYPSNGGRC